MKTKEYIIIALIVIGGNWLFKSDQRQPVYMPVRNEIQLIRDTIIKGYEKNVDSSRNYVESLPIDSSYNILNNWINARIDGTGYNLYIHRGASEGTP